MAQRNWKLAGIANANGECGRVIPGAGVQIPAVVSLSQDGTHLEFGWWGNDQQSPKRIDPDRKMLNAFVRLHTASAAEILKYARRYGGLSLDSVGNPCALRPRIAEPIEYWRYFARRAEAVLNIVASLRNGQAGSVKDWEALKGTEKWIPCITDDLKHDPGVFSILTHRSYPFDANGFGTPAFRPDVDAERSFIALEVDMWLRMGHVTFTVLPAAKSWEMFIDVRSRMLAAVGLQLALILADAADLFICSGHGGPYARPRTTKRPKAGQANYCKTCGKVAALRHADRRRKEKVVEARKLAGQGVPLAEIAKRLKTKWGVETVKRWVRKGESNCKTRSK